MKVGQRVRRHIGSNNGFTPGDTGEIISIYEGTADILMDKNGYVSNTNYISFLRKIEEEKIKMKKVIFNEAEVFNSLDHLMEEHSFIGYEERFKRSLGYGRYMLITNGSAKGFAVTPEDTWSNKEDQKEETEGQYYIFESRKE